MRKINWGVLGTAGIAKGQTIPGMKLAKNCTLHAVAGRDLKKALAYQEAFGFRKAYDSYDQLLEDPERLAHYRKQAAIRGEAFKDEQTVKAVEELLEGLYHG